MFLSPKQYLGPFAKPFRGPLFKGRASGAPPQDHYSQASISHAEGNVNRSSHVYLGISCARLNFSLPYSSSSRRYPATSFERIIVNLVRAGKTISRSRCTASSNNRSYPGASPDTNHKHGARRRLSAGVFFTHTCLLCTLPYPLPYIFTVNSLN